MTEEILHLEYNRALILLKAFNQSDSETEVSFKTGLSPRTIYRDKRRFKIKKKKLTSQPKPYLWYIDGDLKEILNLK